MCTSSMSLCINFINTHRLDARLNSRAHFQVYSTATAPIHMMATTSMIRRAHLANNRTICFFSLVAPHPDGLCVCVSCLCNEAPTVRAYSLLQFVVHRCRPYSLSVWHNVNCGCVLLPHRANIAECRWRASRIACMQINVMPIQILCTISIRCRPTQI